MTREEWKQAIEDHAKSGLSISRYCRERGISDSGFGYWRRKLESAVDGGGTFVRLDSGERVELELPGGKAIKIRRGDLAAVLGVLCGG